MTTTPTDAEVEARMLKREPDDAATKAAIDAFADSMRRCQTWRHGVRAALSAARAVEPNPNELPLEMLPEGWIVGALGFNGLMQNWFCGLEPFPDSPGGYMASGPTPRAAFEAACAATKPPS